MTRHTSRSNKKNKSRSRKQHGGFLGDFFSGIRNTFSGLFGPKTSDTANPSVAIGAPPTKNTPNTEPTQTGGARKKTKKHHHHRHRK